MLVSVVCLRHNGVKVPREHLTALPSIVGELDLVRGYGQSIATLRFPWLGPASHGTNLPRLYECRIHSIRDRSIVLHGAEVIGRSNELRRVPQAWWCQVLPESERLAPRPMLGSPSTIQA